MNACLQKCTPFFITVIGGLMLLAGVCAACLAPAEFYSYYLFTEGGRFHYEGFGFGSFLFGVIAVQIVLYYLMALILIPLGWGHLKRQSWVPKVSAVLLRTWLVAGIPLLLFFLFMLISFKEPSPGFVVFSLLVCVLLYPVVPVSLIRFYESRHVSDIFHAGGKNDSRINSFPPSMLVTVILYSGGILFFHILLLYRGIFPFFGTWLTDLPGFAMTILSIFFLALLAAGTLKRKIWAWWLSVTGIAAFMISSGLSLVSGDIQSLVRVLKFPETEAGMFMNMPLKGWHLCTMACIPLLFLLIAVLYSKKSFHETDR